MVSIAAMDDSFHDIYDELLEEHSDWVSQSRDSGRRMDPRRRRSIFDTYAAVVKAIDQAERHLGSDKSLRSDARLFLLANIHQMVALPLSDQRSKIDLRAQTDRLREDVELIIKAAAKASRNEEEISAAQVLRATTDVLDKLHLSSWRIWDRNPD